MDTTAFSYINSGKCFETVHENLHLADTFIQVETTLHYAFMVAVMLGIR